MPRNKLRNEQMRAESRAAILQMASRLFAEQGFFTVTMADIARTAGMSPGNIYWYFPSKEDLLKTILNDGFDRLDRILAEAASAPGPALDRLMALIQQQLAFMREGLPFFQVYTSILSHGSGVLLKQLGLDPVAIGARYHQHLGAIFADAVREGTLPPNDHNLLATLYFSFFNGLMLTYGRDVERIPPDQLTTAVLRLVGRYEAF